MHQLTDGYGFFLAQSIILFCLLGFILSGIGARFLTARNQPTAPASIPQYRHVPLTDRFVNGMKSTVQIHTDERSLHRNADQIVRQTSGDYGKYHIDTESSVVRLNMTASRPIVTPFSLEPKSRLINKAAVDPSQSMPLDTFDKSFRSTKDPIIMEKKPLETGRSTSRDLTARESSRSGVDGLPYLATLQRLDESFGRQSQKDLLAATKPPRSDQELRWSAISNHRCAQQSEGWAGGLRRPAREAAAVAAHVGLGAGLGAAS